MHPATEMASACTGERPAWLSPSIVSEAEPLVALNTRAWSQFSVAVAGGFGTRQFYASVSGRDMGRGCSTGAFEKIALSASHASGKATSKYVRRCPKGLSGPHVSVAS